MLSCLHGAGGRASRLAGISLLLFASLGAGTNTPYPTGTSVSVTTSAGVVTGVLQEAVDPVWIALLEQQQTGLTFVRADAVIIRRSALTAPQLPQFEAAAPAALEALPRLLDRAALEEQAQAGHFIFGAPTPTDNRFRFTPEGHGAEVEGLTVHVREAFTLGHYNKMKVPAWVAMRWTTDDLIASEEVNLDRPPFSVDGELPLYAQTGRDLDFPQTKLERGHMARDADLEAWGADAVAEGMRMSNICPQRQGKNHAVWGKLEDQHRFIVANPSESGIDAVYIVSGPFFEDDDVVRVGDDGVAVPDGTYKVVAWEGDDGSLSMRAYMIEQEETNTDLSEHLKSVNDVEQATGLDFFPEMEDQLEETLESHVHSTLWGGD